MASIHFARPAAPRWPAGRFAPGLAGLASVVALVLAA